MSSPRSTLRIPIRILGDTQAANPGPAIHTDGNRLALQVILSTNNLFDLEGSLDGFNWVDLTYDNAAGAYTLTAATGLAAGYYEIHERPKWVRASIQTDAGASVHYGVLIIRDTL
jgi:hypothetical protein